jgi:glycosyltransferase involved in cell wall biosynthesis
VLVVFNQFPKRSETFLFRELVGWRRRGLDVRAFSLLPAESRLPGEMAPWSEGVLYLHRLLRPRPALDWLAMARRISAGSTLARTWREVRGGARLGPALAGWAAGPALATVARHLGARRIHAAWGNAPAEAALHASQLTGLPYTVSVHAADVWRDSTPHARRLTAAEWLLVCNRELVSGLLRGHPALEPRLRLVPHGLDTERFASVARRAGPPWRLLTVARLVPKKGLFTLVEVCRQLEVSGLEFTCSLVGEGPLSGSLRRRIRAAGLGSRLRVVGPLDHADVARVMADSHALLMTSRVGGDGDREGLPNVLLEALLTGLPVVATETGSVREVLTDGVTGRLVDVDDASGMVRAVVELCADYERGLAMGQAGRERVLARLDRSDQEEVLARIFSGKAPPSGEQGP